MRTDWRPCEAGPDGDPCEQEDCYICRKFRDDARYRMLWSGPKPPPTVDPPLWRVRLYQFRRFVGRYWSPLRRRTARLWRFTAAVVRHTLAGFPRATEEDVAARRAVCQPCIWRDRGEDECTQCGCHLGGRRQLLSKLAWAKERCPLYDPEKRPGEYWGPVQGETLWLRLWHLLQRKRG